MGVILKAENISKQYRLGVVGTGTLREDLNRWWHRLRGKNDPYLQVGGVNDRSVAASEDYVWALRDINFEVRAGEVLGIIGKNGAGKSTLLKVLSRITSPTTGTIKTKGRIASLLEVGTGFHGELTGRENIFMNGAVLGMTKTEIKRKLDEIIAFSGCEKYIDTPVKRYSSGMTVRLGFAVAAHLEPEILVVDEVLAVGDAEFQKKAIGKMQDLSTGEGRTVLFVSHNMASIQKLCSRAILLKNGELVYDDSPENVVNQYLLDTTFKIAKEAKITDENRKLSGNSDFTLTHIKLQEDNVYSYGELNFEIEFQCLQSFSSLSCTGSICSIDDVRIGSFFSDPFDVKSGKSSLNLKIPSHNLAPGLYYLNISVSYGSLEKDDLKELDHAYNCLNFEITRKEKDSIAITEWKSRWGSLLFPSNIKVKSNGEV